MSRSHLGHPELPLFVGGCWGSPKAPRGPTVSLQAAPSHPGHSQHFYNIGAVRGGPLPPQSCRLSSQHPSWVQWELSRQSCVSLPARARTGRNICAPMWQKPFCSHRVGALNSSLPPRLWTGNSVLGHGVPRTSTLNRPQGMGSPGPPNDSGRVASSSPKYNTAGPKR